MAEQPFSSRKSSSSLGEASHSHQPLRVPSVAGYSVEGFPDVGRHLEDDDGRHLEDDDGRHLEDDDGRHLEDDDGRHLEDDDGRHLEDDDGRHLEGDDGRESGGGDDDHESGGDDDDRESGGGDGDRESGGGDGDHESGGTEDDEALAEVEFRHVEVSCISHSPVSAGSASGSENLPARGASGRSDVRLPKSVNPERRRARNVEKKKWVSQTILRNLRVMTLVSSLIFAFHALFSQYALVVASHLGARYSIANYELNFSHGAEKIGFVVCLLPLSMIVNRFHKPRVVLAGSIICALGSLICSLPYFISGPRTSEDHQVSLKFTVSGLCHLSNSSYTTMKQCDFLSNPRHFDIAFQLFGFGHFVVGFGAAFFATLPLIYVEESATNPSQAPWYISVVLAADGFGRFVGAAIALWFTSVSESVLGSEGGSAWWLGFPVVALLMLVAGIAMLEFPRWFVEPDWARRRRLRQVSLDEQERARTRKRMAANRSAATGRSNAAAKAKKKSPGAAGTSEKSAAAGSSSSGTSGVAKKVATRSSEMRVRRVRTEKLSDLPRNLWKLLHNWMCSASIVGAVFATYGQYGFTSSLPDLASVQFGASRSSGVLLEACAGHLSVSLGILAGGLVISRRRWSLYRSSRLAVLCLSLSACLLLLGMACSCDIVPVDRSPVCSDLCYCKDIQVQPVCSNGTTYQSACHAGCVKVVYTSTQQSVISHFTKCSCGSEATEGACAADYCWQYFIYGFLSFFALFFVGAASVPVLIIFLRGVREKGRSLSLGFSVWVVYLVGMMPARSLYSLLRGTACRDGEPSKTCGGDVLCLEFDLLSLRLVVHGSSALALLAASLCFLVVTLRLRRSSAPPRKSLGQPVHNEAFQPGL